MALEYYLDTDKLRLHAQEIRKEQHLSMQIYDKLYYIRQQADPEFENRLTRIIQDVQKLKLFFEKLAKLMEEISDEAELVSVHIRRIMEEAQWNPETVLKTDYDF